MGEGLTERQRGASIYFIPSFIWSTIFIGYLSWAGCGQQGDDERNAVPSRAYDEVGARKGAERRGVKKSRV